MQVELKESKREILPEIKMQGKQIILPEAVQEPEAKPPTQMQLEQEPEAKTPTVMQLEQEPEAKLPLQIQLEQEMKMASTENQPQKKASGVPDGYVYSAGDGSKHSGGGGGVFQLQIQQEMVRTEVEEKKMKYPVKQDQQEMARTAVEEKK